MHVDASPRGACSASRQVAQALADAWQARHPRGATDVLPGSVTDVAIVWATELPAFDGAALHAKHAGLEGWERTACDASKGIHGLAGRFHQATGLLPGTPIRNFGIQAAKSGGAL